MRGLQCGEFQGAMLRSSPLIRQLHEQGIAGAFQGMCMVSYAVLAAQCQCTTVAVIGGHALHDGVETLGSNKGGLCNAMLSSEILC